MGSYKGGQGGQTARISTALAQKHQQIHMLVPKGMQWYPMIPNDLRYLHPEFKASVACKWYTMVCEAFDRELWRYVMACK